GCWVGAWCCGINGVGSGKGAVWHGTAWHGTAQHSTARHSMALHCIAQHGMAWHGTGLHSSHTAWHSTALHSLAQHGMARHSTAHFTLSGLFLSLSQFLPPTTSHFRWLLPVLSQSRSWARSPAWALLL
uniref:Uncharacterized protein n=1 Tax=Cairina moschata TaxID=8855 RepID=A0A8C3BV39_CAIMO